MKDFQFKFDVTSFNNIFPFYILIDKNLAIKSFGESLTKIIPELREGTIFNNAFIFKSPFLENISPQNFDETLTQLIVLESKSNNTISLKGQIIKHNEQYLFVGSPWFESIEGVIANKLTLHDFAIHDPLLDLLHVLKTQEINNSELKELLEVVNKQRKKLKKDKEEQDKISLVASANKNGVVFTHPDGKILWCNDAYIKLTGFLYNEIIGKTPIEIGRCALSNKEEIHKMITAFYKGEEFDVEGIHASKNGDVFWSKTTGQPVFDGNGKLLHYFAMLEDISLEKEKEEQLLVLSSIAETNINAVVISDLNGRIEWVNPSFQKMSGYSIEELIGQKPGHLLQGPETDKVTVNYLNHQIKKGLPFNCEIINYSKSNQKYWVRIQGQALYNKKGEIIKYFAIEEDISSEKEINQQLIESENRLTSLIKNIQSGILLEDDNNKILVVNNKFIQQFGIKVMAEMMVGFECNIVSGESMNFFKNPEKFIKRVEEIRTNKEPVFREEIELLDGRIFERSFMPITRGNHYEGNLWTYEDITIQKKHKEILEAEKEKYSRIIANMNMGLVEVDNEDTIQLVNQSFCEMSGYSLLDLLGKKASKVLSLDSESKKVIQNKNSNRIDGNSDSYELSLKNEQGELRHWLISGGPNYNINGEVIGSIGIHLDITNQKSLELQQELLLKKLEKQNEQLNEYAQIVSHDLKSPLQSIHTLISWIKEDNDKEFNEQTKQYLGMIENKVEKMDHLIQGILTYSKVDSAEVLNEKVNLNEIVCTIINIIHVPSNISIKINNELPTIFSERFRMQQLFQNLINNAVNYIDKPIGIVEIASIETDEDYVFTIKDNGIGIAKNNQEKVFKMFQSFTEQEQSTGIGLSIVKRIVENHKGKIWLESQLGKGTTFFIKLPK